jgi:DNA-binding HxlR family transcriptional regulator
MSGTLDPRGAWTADRCTIAKALDEVSTRSAFLILREAFYGTTRFEDFAQRAGISEPVAASRLRQLVEHGLLERADYRETGKRTRQRYRLTDKGADLFPALVALMQWGDRWLDDTGGPVGLRHADCGGPVYVELRCAANHRVGPDELHLVSRGRQDQSGAQNTGEAHVRASQPRMKTTQGGHDDSTEW